jgi:hypothetical protein
MLGELTVSAAQPGTTNGVREFAYTPPCTTVTPTSTPTGGTVLGQDTFQRARQSLWGYE